MNMTLVLTALLGGLAPGSPLPVPVRALPPLRADTIRLVQAPTGNEARFIVREQLASLTLPNDAIGTTTGITGSILLDAGRPVAGGSKFTVDMASLHTDRDRRDNYIKRRTLEVERFPTATLVVTGFQGLPDPLPDSGAFAFQLAGDLTIHGVTRPSTWQVTAEARDGAFSGTATTHVTFEDFGMAQPRVAVVLSVQDDIRLEYHFNLVRQHAGGE